MYKKILVPIDGSHTSMLGLDEAIRLASHCKARLRILHVVDKLVFTPTVETARYLAGMEKAMRADGRRLLARAQALAGKQGLKADAVLRENVGRRAAEAIVEQAKSWRADVIVVGTHGRRGISRLVMGSDAEQVVRTAPVPVLIVRSRADRG